MRVPSIVQSVVTSPERLLWLWKYDQSFKPLYPSLQSQYALWFPLQAEADEYGIRLAEQSERLQKAEELSEQRAQQVEELQRLLQSMEKESGSLKEKMAAGEAELQQLKADRGDEGEKEQR